MQTHLRFLFIFALLIFISCSSDKPEPPAPIDRKEVKFKSTIVSQTVARSPFSANSQWSDGSAIGVYMLDSGNETVSENISNQKFTTKVDGNFVTAGATPAYYPVEGKVDFIAYHPYGSPTNDIYTVNLSDQTSQQALVLLYADRVIGKSAVDSDVTLNFKHKLAKLIITVVKGREISTLDGLEVRMDGMCTKSNFDLIKGIMAEGSAIQNFILAKNGEDTFEATLLPTTINEQTVVLTLDKNSLTWSIKDDISAFEAGKKYTYTITINSNKIVVSGKIEDWTNFTGEDNIVGK